MNADYFVEGGFQILLGVCGDQMVLRERNGSYSKPWSISPASSEFSSSTELLILIPGGGCGVRPGGAHGAVGGGVGAQTSLPHIKGLLVFSNVPVGAKLLLAGVYSGSHSEFTPVQASWKADRRWNSSASSLLCSSAWSIFKTRFGSDQTLSKPLFWNLKNIKYKLLHHTVNNTQMEIVDQLK